jgi:hypothetical protein
MIIQLIGWLGAFLLILAYGLVSSRKISPVDKSFQIFNILGAFFLGVSSYFLGAWFSVGLNIFWILVGIITITKSVK